MSTAWARTSCKKDSCLLHMWLFSRHQLDNKEQIERFDGQLQNEAGVRLIYVNKKKVYSTSTASTSARSSLPISKPRAPASKPSIALSGSSMAFILTSTLSFCNAGEHGFKQAVRKKVRLNKKKDPGVETVSPQEGSQLFLFQPVDGLHHCKLLQLILLFIWVG